MVKKLKEIKNESLNSTGETALDMYRHTQGNSKKTRVVYFDILNIIAMIAVVSMHCNGIVHNNPNTRAWNTSLIVDCVCYWAVPVFCMLSGATLLNYRKKYDTKTFFKKRAQKVLIPFICWAIIMFIFKICTNQLDVSNYTIRDYFNAFFNNYENGIYYFMFVILGIYLTIPLLSLVTKEENNKILDLTIIMYFIFNSFIPNILKLFKINYNNDFSIQIGPYIIFVLLGYILSTRNISKKKRILIYVGAIVGLLYRYIITYIISKKSGTVYKEIWGYNSWHSILLACAVFLIIKNLNFDERLKDNKKLKKFLWIISSCSFGIYLIHMLIIYYEIKIFNINEYSWEWRTIGILTTYLISLGIIFILKKIPIIKRLVP